MGKRHHTSRRRAYGRRQHEVRERYDRPAREALHALGVRVYDIGPADGLVLDPLPHQAGESAPISIVPASAD